ncbi:MAG: hypothetical protein ACTSWK_07270 [Promethearchaeota archaeon]
MDTNGLLLLWQEDDMVFIVDKSNTLTATEAIFAFCAWLTTRKETIKIGSNIHIGPVVDAINQFMETNNLPDPRGNYTDYFVMPS